MADDTDDIFEDDTANIIDKALSEQGFDDDMADDDGGMDQPPEEPGEFTENRVSAEEGARLASDAKLNATKATPEKPEDEAGPEGEEAESPDETPKAEDKPDEKAEEKEPADLSAMAETDLLADLPDDRREEVARRLKASTEAMAPFESAFAKSEMQRWGASPAQMATRLTEIAEHASRDPAGYLAWAVKEMAAGPDKIEDVLKAAAEKLGYQVSASDDDLFDDEETIAARRQQRLSSVMGPDDPQVRQYQQAERSMAAFINEVDPATGQPKRPLFQTLQPQIHAAAQQLAEQRGGGANSLTFDDLGAIYDHIVGDLQKAGGVNLAAQPAPVPAQPKQDAAATAKAKRASMSVDGGGPGAPRRPAHDPNDLTGLIGRVLDDSMGR